MNENEYNQIYQKAVSLGYDPFKDPIGAYLAGNNSIWCVLFECALSICIISIAKGSGGLGILGGIFTPIFLLCYISSLFQLALYSRSGFFSLLLVSLLMSWTTAPAALAAKFGLLRR